MQRARGRQLGGAQLTVGAPRCSVGGVVGGAAIAHAALKGALERATAGKGAATDRGVLRAAARALQGWRGEA